MATKLLEEELAWIVATDAHNLEHRPPDLAQGYQCLVDICGSRTAKRMVETRPGRILGLEQ